MVVVMVLITGRKANAKREEKSRGIRKDGSDEESKGGGEGITMACWRDERGRM
jgi:hypothetical protein